MSDILGAVGGVRVIEAGSDNAAILLGPALAPDEVEIQFREGNSEYPARISTGQLEAAMRLPIPLRAVGDVNYWFGRHSMYGTYSGSLTPADVLSFHNGRVRSMWAPFRLKALSAHGLDAAPVSDTDACDECGEHRILEPFWATPNGATSTELIPYFLCVDCEAHR